MKLGSKLDTLYPFQRFAVARMLKYLTYGEAHSVYNACEQGLGKCAQTIAAVTKLRADAVRQCPDLSGYQTHVLIICPAVMRLTWRDEILKWSDYPYDKIKDDIRVVLKSRDIQVLERTTYGPIDYVIISYDLCHKPEILDKLLELEADVLVLDEAHFLKNSRAKRTKAILKKLWDTTTFRIALSGTPFTTRIVDGYTLFKRMLPSRFPDFHSFVQEFSYAKPTPWGIDYFGVKNPERLSKIIRSNFYIRYLKKEVLPELPDKVFQKIPLPQSYAIVLKDAEKQDLATAVCKAAEMLSQGKACSALPRCLAEHRRMQGEKKLPPIIEFIQNQLDQDIPLVVFAWHHVVIDRLCAEFAAYKPCVITGSTSAINRYKAVSDFQEGKTPLFIGNIMAAGTGITLHRSSTCVLAELDWSPSTIAQSIDRLHRIGQKDTVNIFYFVVNNSIDETISNVLMSRVETFKKVLDSKPENTN